MRLIEDILAHRSLSVVGMDKNTGKTETLGWILRNLPSDLRLAVTSVGTDGERRDLVTGTHKPEISLGEGTVFATAEKYFRRRRLSAEVLAIDEASTAAGRVVTARALTGGTVILSGPPTTEAMARWMGSLERYAIGLTLVDGALGRLSSASPVVSEAMILATGAALSADMDTLVRETAYAVEKIRLPLADAGLADALTGLENGIWAVDGEGRVAAVDGYPSFAGGIVMPEKSRAVYVAGALTERLAAMIEGVTGSGETNVIVEDFTRIFLSLRSYAAMKRRGVRISVLRRTNLLAVTVNPVSPAGFRLDTDALSEKIAAATGVPVYDIMR